MGISLESHLCKKKCSEIFLFLVNVCGQVHSSMFPIQTSASKLDMLREDE